MHRFLMLLVRMFWHQPQQMKADKMTSNNLSSAKAIGQKIAERAIEAGIKKVVFDRSGYKYHGRIKAIAESAREAGLEF